MSCVTHLIFAFAACAAILVLQGCGSKTSLIPSQNTYTAPSGALSSGFSTPVQVWALSSSTLDVSFINTANSDKLIIIFDTGSLPFFVLSQAALGQKKVDGNNGQPIIQKQSYADGSGFNAQLCASGSSKVQISNQAGNSISSTPAFYEIVIQSDAEIKQTVSFFKDSNNSGIIGAGYSQPSSIFETTYQASEDDMNFYTTAVDKILSDNSMARQFGVQMCPVQNENMFTRNSDHKVIKPINTGAHIDFGFFNTSHYTDALQYTNVNTAAAEVKGLWCIEIQSITITWPPANASDPNPYQTSSPTMTISKTDLTPTSANAGTGNSQCQTIVDTGMDTGMSFVGAAWTKLLDAYGLAKHGFGATHTIPLKDMKYMPTMAISFANADGSGNFDVTLPPTTAIFRAIDSNAVWRVLEESNSPNVLGQGLLAAYYTAFDRSQSQATLGFAPLKGCVQPSSKTNPTTSNKTNSTT